MYTIEDVINVNPCYTRQEVEMLYNIKGVMKLSALEICDYHSVPIGDRIWVLIRLLDREVLRSIVWDITNVYISDLWHVDVIGAHLSNDRVDKCVAREGVETDREQEAQLAVFRKNILLFTKEFDYVYYK